MRPITRRALALAVTLVIGAAVVTPASHASWSTPAVLFQDAGSALFAAAGDPSGRAFLVAGGTQPDVPLVLTERSSTRIANSYTTFEWQPGRPLDGASLPFTTSGLGRSAMRAAAAGAGAGAIAFRYDGETGDQLAALVREPGEDFGPAKRVLSPDSGWLTDPALAISPHGTVAIAFGALANPDGATTRPASVTRGQASVIVRVAGNPWGRIRSLTTGDVDAPAVAVGADDQALVAWLHGTRVEGSLFDDKGTPGRVVRLGSARTGGRIAVAGGPPKHDAVVWADANRVVRVAQRTGSGFLKARKVQPESSTSVSGLTAVIDDRSRTFIAWRDGTADAASIVVAFGTTRGSFTVATIATGAGLGDPAIAARPGGGAIVGWRAPSGWSAAAAPPSGVFGSVSTVSAPLGPGDETLRVPAVFAGPTTAVDLVWLQNLVNVPVPGPVILAAYGDESVTP